jgi:hypothetical protein
MRRPAAEGEGETAKGAGLRLTIFWGDCVALAVIPVGANWAVSYDGGVSHRSRESPRVEGAWLRS